MGLALHIFVLIQNPTTQEIARSMSNQGPYLHEIILDLNQSFAPKLTSKKLEWIYGN